MEEDRPIVIAHRGASGYAPEHTLMAYKLGIEQGADYIEPDLVMTKDGHLVARHDAYLSDSTDVAERPEFADRKRTLRGKEDWWTFDFTLAEIRSLKARQARPKSRSTEHDGQLGIPTIDEIVDFTVASRGDRPVGLYVEMKHPEEFIALGLDPTEALVDFFGRARKAGIPVYFQCFSGPYLERIATESNVPLIWLIEGQPEADGGQTLDVELGQYGTRLAGVGLYKNLLMTPDKRSTGVLQAAHSLGYKVHIWTMRDDQVGTGYDTIDSEMQAFWHLGVDGVFTDFPDTGVKTRAVFLADQ